MAIVEPQIRAKELALEFIEHKHAEGALWLSLFKNHSGQHTFTVYDSTSGVPSSKETVFLTADAYDRGSVLPRHMQVKTLYRSLAVGIEYDALTEADAFMADIQKGYELLRDSRTEPSI